MPLPLGIYALGVMSSAALATLASEVTKKALRRKTAEEETIEGEDNMSQYDLVGWDADEEVGHIGADLLLAGIDGVEDLIGAGEDEALLQALAVSGAGNTELIGAVKAAAVKKKQAAALKAIAMRNAGAVMQRGLDRRRRYPLGFVPTSVASATAAAIPAAPQNLFRPERLVIPSDIAFDVGVRDIKVGNQSQLVQSVEVPAALFSEVAINTGVTFDTAEVGNQVSVDVRNKSGATLEFSAGLVGSIAK